MPADTFNSLATAYSLPTDTICLRILLAAILGAVVGLEREFTQKSAGLRTHMLVCIGATIFTIISMADFTQMTLPQVNLPEGVHMNISRDPSRIAAQIVTGIGFIGGGAVLKDGGSIRGITTAASLWMMAAVGMLTGAGMITVAVFSTLLAFLTLFMMGKLERKVFHKNLKEQDRLSIDIICSEETLDTIAHHVETDFKSDLLTVDVQKLFHPTETEPYAMALHYVVDIEGKTISWTRWRQRIEQLEGIRALKLRFFKATESLPL
ncbi:MAG: MgtC/SapB family protein [Candidatus Melainabacteria bacterium]|nr:MgtC/SapB family protein [Candidatus Melainabacteria bacterium]